MLKKLLIAFVLLFSLFNTAYAGDELDFDVHEDNEMSLEDDIVGNLTNLSGDELDTIEQNEVYKDSTFKGISKTFSGVVVNAGSRYEEHDEWIQDMTPYQDVRVKITEGEYSNIVLVKYQLSYFLGSSIPADELKVGDKVYVNVSYDEDGVITQTYIEYINNERFLVAMAIIYAGAVILIGGMKGVKALVGLILTILAVFFIMVPLIFEGYPPLFITILTCILVSLITFIIISGFSKKTFAAVLGTAGGIIVAGIFAIIFGNLMKLTGACEHSNQLSMIENGSRFDFEGIMVSGIIVGALGACMDVGMSIASSIHEISENAKGMTVRQLIKSGMNIGKDVMGTMTNTLILAYVGSSLIVILLLKGNHFEAYQIANNTELVVEEVLRAIAGSFGLVFTIPITACISSLLMGKKENEFYER